MLSNRCWQPSHFRYRSPHQCCAALRHSPSTAHLSLDCHPTAPLQRAGTVNHQVNSVVAQLPMAQPICQSNPSHHCQRLLPARGSQHRLSHHRHRLHVQFQSAHSRQQRPTGQHATAPDLASAVTASAHQPVAAAPRQQTGNEHLDGKLKIIGKAVGFLQCLLDYTHSQSTSCSSGNACVAYACVLEHTSQHVPL